MRFLPDLLHYENRIRITPPNKRKSPVLFPLFFVFVLPFSTRHFLPYGSTVSAAMG